MSENNQMFTISPLQSSTNLQDLLMCETYFDDFTSANSPGNNAPAPQPPTTSASDFDAQIQALLAANTPDLNSMSNATDFSNFNQWKIENDSVSSPESLTLLTPDMLALSSPDSLALLNSPLSYTTGDEDSMNALSPPPFGGFADFGEPLLPDINDFPEIERFQELMPTKTELAAAIAHIENVRKRQTVDDDLVLDDDDDDNDSAKNKKRKGTTNSNRAFRKSSNASSKSMRKKQYIKDQTNPQAANAYVQGMGVPMLFSDATAGAQSIVVPNSPTVSPSDVSSNFSTNTLLALGPGAWPSANQPVSAQTPSYVKNLGTDLQTGFDITGQLSGIPLAAVTRDGLAANEKVPIKRLKPSSGSQTVTNIQSQPNKQQKKVAHNAIERRYRNNINDRINDLKNVVPALCHLKSKDSKEEDDDEIDGIPAATKLNKATILRKATEYIIYLKKNNQQYKEENNNLKKMIQSLPGGITLYSQYIRNCRSLIQDDSVSNDGGSSGGASPNMIDNDSDTPVDPPVLPTENTGSRVLMALFMCMTFFTSPSEYGQADHTSHSHEGRVEGIITEPIPKGNSVSNDGTISIDLWYFARIFTFLLCLTFILRPSIFSNQPRRNRKSKQLIATILATKTKDAKSLYQWLSDHTFGGSITMLEQAIGFSTEFFKFFMRRFIGWDITGGFAIQDNDRMGEVGLWGRLGEVELCGGNKKASRLSILYTSLRTVNLLETTYTTRKHIFLTPSRIYANAALQCYIGLSSMPFIAERAASHFWKKAILLKGRSGGEEKWLEIALSSDQESDMWKSVAKKIATYALQQSPKEVSDEEMKGTTVPLAHISDAQSLSLLKEAYFNFISFRYGKKVSKNVQLSFAELVNVTTPASLTHWYALVGCAVQAFSVGDNATGEKLVNRLKEGYPKNESDNNKQIVGMGLLSYALLMYGKVEASARCADKAGVSIFRRNKEEKSSSQNVTFPDDQDYEIKKIEREIHDLAEFCTGWLVLEARVLGWKIIEELVTGENKTSTLPEVLNIDARLKPGVQGWLTYMRRLNRLGVFDNQSIARACQELLKLLDALSRVLGGVEEFDDLSFECEEQTETAEKRELERRAARAWCALKGT